MRLCIDQKDPGYKPSVELARYRVLFNGVERHDCHTADEEKGYIRILSQRRIAPWLPVTRTVSGFVYGKVEIQRK